MSILTKSKRKEWFNVRKNNKMPKVEISYLLFSNMLKYAYLNKLNDEQFAEALEVTTRTLRSYKDNPNTINLERVQLFLDNMGMDIQALLVV